MIPFNKVSANGREMEYMAQAVANGNIAGGGKFTKRAEALISSHSGGGRSLLTTNCTHSLELAARLLDIGPGDEVIVPAFTFVSTASAFAMTGAKPVFVDVRSSTLNLDIDEVRAALSNKTRAVCTVHYAGIGEDVDKVKQLCEQQGVVLVEDNAHGFTGTYAGLPLGSFGALSTLSFHETKNFSCGEGGALVINTPELVDRAEILREKGTDRARFLRGQTDKYTWVDMGSSWIPSELLAAFLVGQLERASDIQESRMERWLAYDELLADWSHANAVRRPFVPELASHPAHMYFLRFNSLSERTAFIHHMRRHEVLAVFHYQALNASPQGTRFGGRRGACPVSEQAADTLVRLPLFAGMSDDEFDHVVEAVLSFGNG